MTTHTFFKSLGKVFISCVIYATLSHNLLRVSYQGLNVLESAVRSFAVYSVMFIVYAAIPVSIAVLVAKIPKENRLKPFGTFLNGALGITWALALVGLYFGWYATNAAG
jgi:hypothetical protein